MLLPRTGSVMAGSPADLVHLDLAGWDLRLFGTPLGVAVVAAAPAPADQIQQHVVARSGSHRSLEIHPLGGEQAGEEAAIGGQPRARARSAEGLRHRRDDADLSRAVVV